MTISLEEITKLRNQTGAGVADCKEALETAGGDFDKAIEFLRKKGAKTANKRADRSASEGLVHAYIHSNNKVGALVTLQCETDFVAKNADFKDLANDLAMQIVATSPDYIKPENIPAEVLEKERAFIVEQLKEQGKPDDMIAKITEGKINKWYEEVCLYRQPFIKNEDITIEEYINEKIASIGEKVQVGSFVKMEISGASTVC